MTIALTYPQVIVMEVSRGELMKVEATLLLPILKLVLVEVSRGKLADVGMHAILDSKHDDRSTTSLQPLKQAPLQLQMLCFLAQYCRRQLLWISHEHRPACIVQSAG